MDTTLTNRPAVKIVAYTPPASPGASSSVPITNGNTPVFPTTTTASATVPTSNLPTHHHQPSSPVSGDNTVGTATSSRVPPTFMPMFTPASTPKKDLLNAAMLQTIREKLLTPGGSGELQALAFENQEVEQGMAMKLVKERYLISAQPSHISAAAAAKTPASYRHLIDLTSSNLKCIDVYTGEEFLCKIINEPLHKVQRAYFQLQQDDDLCHSKIYGHALIRGVQDIVPLSSNRTYIIIAPVHESRDTSGIAMGVYENLHTYIRNQKRIGEAEARTIFHQICQTVQVCHRNGIILRDLKLKRFYFIDEARTKLQYESLEGSMILDDPTDDTLSDKIGCPLYTAPELLCPHPTYQGKPADMWSLGVILYTMLVGQYPFYEKANCNLITIIRHGNVQIPSSLSKSVRWLLLSLLRKNFAERLTASHIFLVPWLREQRPFYMYLPVNVEVMEDDVDDVYNDSFSEGIAELQLEETSSVHVTQQEEDDDIGVQPLDYTHTTLQMEEQLAAAAVVVSTRVSGGSVGMEMDVDVGMG